MVTKIIITLLVGTMTIILMYYNESKKNKKSNNEWLDKINEKSKNCPTVDEIIKMIENSNIGILSIGIYTNYSSPYFSYCYTHITRLELDGKEWIISYDKETFYKVYSKMIKELKDYNIQLIDSETVRFNKIH